jgi:hypothetical protein
MSELPVGELPQPRDKDIQDPDLPITWPHEEAKGTKSAFKYRVPHVSDYGNGVEGQMEAMRRLNGEESAPLADKYSFVEIVKELGYTTPEQTLVTTGQDEEERRDQVAQHFPNPDQAVICNPHDGHGGLGIVEMSAGDLAGFVPTVGQDYIIQERVPINAEIRYARQVDENAGIIRRIYDEKTIPKVVGDGQQTKGQLIQQGEVPWYSRKMTEMANRSTLDDVVPDNSSVHMSFFGVPHKEEDELEWSEGKKQRVANIDLFMKKFIADIQTKVGTKLPYLCFDVGVIDPSVLDKKYESEQEAFDVLKKNLVPFESQMPFSAYGYMRRSSKSRLHQRRMMKNILGTVMTGKKEDFLKDE